MAEQTMEKQENPKKLVFYLGSLAKGGAEHVAVNLAEYFNSIGWQVTMVTKLRADEEYETSEAIGRVIADIAGKEISRSRVANFNRRIKKLRNIFAELSPDVIISFIGKNNFMAVQAAGKLMIPVIVSVRSAPEREYKSRAMHALVKPMFRRAAGVVLQTKDARDYFPEDIQKKSIILPNSVNPKFLQEQYYGERRQRVVTVGRMDVNKNQILLIHAFEQIADEFPELELYLYGDGPSRSKWEEEVKQTKYASRIHFPGVANDIYDRIREDRIFVLPSIMEGMPNALIEAMALGLANVSTDCPCGGPRELLGDNENGLLVPVGDADAMAEAMRRILTDPELEQRLQNNAYRKAQELEPGKVNEMWKEYVVRICKK